MAEMTRFHIPESVRNLIQVALATRVIDTFDLYALGQTHGENFFELAQELCVYAHNQRHGAGDTGRRNHELIVKAADAVYAKLNSVKS